MWILLILGGLGILIAGGELLVRGASRIAFSFQISPLVVGLTIVAFGTSAPELLISVVSALDGQTGVAMGNIVGSNICNLTLVLGVTAVFYPIVVSDNSIKIDWLMAMGSALLLYFFVNEDKQVERFEGVIFIVCLIIYTYFLIEMSRKETREKMSLEQNVDIEEIPNVSGTGVWKEILFVVGGSIGLFIGAFLFVKGVEDLGHKFQIPEHVLGLTVVALGTSLPELVTSAIAAYKKSTDLAIGNLLGSCIFNILCILGITSSILNIPVNEHILETDMLWMLGITLLVLPMMISRRKIGRIEGGILLIVYFYYMYNLMKTSSLGSSDTAALLGL